MLGILVQITYTDEQLSKLDRMAKQNGFKYRSTLKIKNNSNT